MTARERISMRASLSGLVFFFRSSYFALLKRLFLFPFFFFRSSNKDLSETKTALRKKKNTQPTKKLAYLEKK